MQVEREDNSHQTEDDVIGRDDEQVTVEFLVDFLLDAIVHVCHIVWVELIHHDTIRQLHLVNTEESEAGGYK